MNYPGFEPGSTAWKAAILTTRLIIHIQKSFNGSLLRNFRGQLEPMKKIANNKKYYR